MCAFFSSIEEALWPVLPTLKEDQEGIRRKAADS